MIKVIATIAAGILIALAAGCGSSDSSSLSKAEYTKQAKVICHKGEQEKEEAIDAAMLRYQEGEKIASPAMQREAVAEVLAPYERTTVSLAELEPPPTLEKKVQALLRLREEAPKIMEADPQKALHDSAPIEKGIKASEALGLGRCDY